MTGFRTCRRGVSLRNASTIACRMIPGSNSARALIAVAAMALSPFVETTERGVVDCFHELPLRRDQVEMLDDGTECQRRNERQGAHEDDHADQEPDEERSVSGQRPGTRRDSLLAGQGTRDGQ